MIKMSLAIIFVLTAGSLFSKQFRANQYLALAAGAVALASAYYLVLAIRGDVSNFRELLGTIREEEVVLTGLPETIQTPTSTFQYQIERGASGLVAKFSKDSIDYLFRHAPQGDLAGAMFSVTFESGTEAVCQHFIPYSAPSPSDLGVRELGQLIQRLDCGVWHSRGDGGSSRVPGKVRAHYNRSNSSLELFIEGEALASTSSKQDEIRTTFRVGFPTTHQIIEQTVLLR